MIRRNAILTKFVCLFHVVINIRFLTIYLFESSKRLKTKC